MLHVKPLYKLVEENITWDILIPSTNDAGASSFAQVLGKEEPEARYEQRKQSMSYVFVVDTNRKPLNPVHPGEARYLLKVGKAAVLKRYPFTISAPHHAV